MYSVIKHTYELEDTQDVLNTRGEWKHYCWNFSSQESATQYAIHLIMENPLIQANDYFLKQAIESLINNRYFQHGKESIAIGTVLNPVDLEDNFENEYKKYLH